MMSRRKYIVRIMNARPRPMETKTVDKVRVMRACCGENGRRTGANTPPVADATTRVTTGRSHTVVIRLNE